MIHGIVVTTILSLLSIVLLLRDVSVKAFPVNRQSYPGRKIKKWLHQHSSAASDGTTSDASSSPPPFLSEDFFLNQVHCTIHNILSSSTTTDHPDADVATLPTRPHQRQAWAVARHVQSRLAGLHRNQDCPRCWLQRKHCICEKCPPLLELSGEDRLGRLFVLMHHKEVGLKVDTAKLLLSTFPQQARWVVAGMEYREPIGSYQEGDDKSGQLNEEHGSLFPQASMHELHQLLWMPQPQPETSSSSSHSSCDTNTLILFPTETALTMNEIRHDNQKRRQHITKKESTSWNVIVIDGTWAQARKMYKKYLQQAVEESNGRIRCVQLSAEAVAALDTAMLPQNDKDVNADVGATKRGHQLRRHSMVWRQVGTFEATRLFLMNLYDDDDSAKSLLSSIQPYQEYGNAAARCELGPPRLKKHEKAKQQNHKTRNRTLANSSNEN